MQLGKVFKAASVSFKKNRSKILMFALSLAVLISAVYILFDVLLGVGLIFAALLVFPLLVSVDVIAMKAVDNIVIENSDFYIGLKKYGTSFYLKIRTLIKGLIIALVAFIIVALIGSMILMIRVAQENPQILQGTVDVATLYDTIGSIPWMEEALNYVSYASFIAAFLCYFLFGYSNALSPFVCYQTRFPVDTALTLSKKYTEANKKFFRKYSFIFFLIFLPMVAIGVALNRVLLLANMAQLPSYIISFFISSFLIALYTFYYKIAYYHIYRHYFKDAIDDTFKKHMEKLMGIRKAEEVPLDISSGDEDINPDDFNNDDNQKTGE